MTYKKFKQLDFVLFLIFLSFLLLTKVSFIFSFFALATAVIALIAVLKQKNVIVNEKGISYKIIFLSRAILIFFALLNIFLFLYIN